jgi:hypothetical protein
MTIGLATLLAAALAAAGAVQAPVPGQVPRDTPGQTRGQTAGAPSATGRISGRVIAGDTGRPIVRARVSLSAPQGGGRVVLTDNTGAYELTGLPEGRFTLQASKSGFIALQYGQRRPLQAGTPIQIGAGQELRGVDFRLPRGGAISGRVFDENNDPMPGIPVRVLEYRYAQGNRQLMDVGNAQTDDRGEYRVWGLNPGEYYVSATPPPPLGNAARGGGPGPFGGRGLPVASAAEQESFGYAPTYFPGVTSVGDARPVALGLSSELADVSFSVTLVRTARISGRVTNADGTPAANGNLTLVTDAPGRNGGSIGRTYGARVAGDGQFTIANVPPGRYTLRARSGPGGRGRGGAAASPMFASIPLVVSGEDVANVQIALAPAASVSGTATFESTQNAAAPPPNQFRVMAPPADFDGSGNGQTAIDARTGTFTIQGLAPGEHLLQAQSPRGWTLKSALVDGRESVDRPFQLGPGQKLANVTLVFTDRITEVAGTVADGRGAPVTDYTVLAFPDDESLWRPQSRHIMTARPDQNGRYQLRGLPAGRYFLAVIDPAVQGEWFEPAFLQAQRSGAKQILLGEGESKTQDFAIAR